MLQDPQWNDLSRLKWELCSSSDFCHRRLGTERPEDYCFKTLQSGSWCAVTQISWSRLISLPSMTSDWRDLRSQPPPAVYTHQPIRCLLPLCSQLAPLYVSTSARGHWSAPVCLWLCGLIDWCSDRLSGRYGHISTWLPAAAAAAVFSSVTSAQRHDSNSKGKKPNSWLVSLQINLQIIVMIVESEKSKTQRRLIQWDMRRKGSKTSCSKFPWSQVLLSLL